MKRLIRYAVTGNTEKECLENARKVLLDFSGQDSNYFHNWARIEYSVEAEFAAMGGETLSRVWRADVEIPGP